MTAPQDPYLSPDGHWRWDGAQWVPAAWSWQPPPPRSGHDGKAIASFVVSLVGLCGINSLVAVVLGHQSRREARRQGREPSGFALAGLIIGYVGLVAAAAVAALFTVGVATTRSCAGDGCGTVQVDAAGPAAVALHDAQAAQERYRTSHGVYAGSTASLGEAGYTDPDGVTVSVLWVQGEFYCMRGVAADSTLYLAAGRDEPGVATPTPCE